MDKVTKNYLIAIVGPTAVGKTSLSIQLAEIFQTEILSADARQFYRDMAIGTAQPTLEERKGIPHHFLSFLSVQDFYTAGQFAREALQKLNHIFTRKPVAILTGGSGLYIKALCEGLADIPTIAPGLRKILTNVLQQKGLPYLITLLKQKDPNYASVVDLNNPQRVIRALEVYLETGIPYSILRNAPPKEKRDFSLIKIGLTQEKQIYVQHIERRVETMMEQGLLQEVEKLYAYRHTPALQTLGYKELFDYIEGKSTLEQAIVHIKINTKKYAKRQLTWFKKDKNIVWFAPHELFPITQYIKAII